MRSGAIQKRLLAEADLTIKRAQEIAQGMESADKSAKDLKGGVGVTGVAESVNLAAHSNDLPSGESSLEISKPRYRCGRRHDEKRCKFKDTRCHSCGKMGHLARVCKTSGPPPVYRSKYYGSKFHGKKEIACTKWMGVDREEETEVLPMLTLGDVPRPPILVALKLMGTPVQF